MTSVMRSLDTKLSLALLGGIRILLVDDSEDNRVLFERILRSAGAHVDLAEDGREAIERSKLSHYDVIVMDIRMPHVDGYEASATIRRQGFVGPIIALTAHANPDEEHRCRLSGCSDFHLKPIDRVSLLSAVHLALVRMQRFHLENL